MILAVPWWCYPLWAVLAAFFLLAGIPVLVCHYIYLCRFWWRAVVKSYEEKP